MKEAEDAQHGYFLSVSPRSLFAVSEGRLITFEVIRAVRTKRLSSGDVINVWPTARKRREMDAVRENGGICCLIMLAPDPWHSWLLPLSRELWDDIDAGETDLDDFLLTTDDTLISKAVSFHERSDDLAVSSGRTDDDKPWVKAGNFKAVLDHDQVVLGHEIGGARMQASLPIPFNARKIIDFVRETGQRAQKMGF